MIYAPGLSSVAKLALFWKVTLEMKSVLWAPTPATMLAKSIWISVKVLNGKEITHLVLLFIIIFQFPDIDINRTYHDVTLTPGINYHGYVAKEFDGVSAAAKCKVKCDMEGKLGCSFYVFDDSGKCQYGLAPVVGVAENSLGHSPLTNAGSIFIGSGEGNNIRT